MLALEVRTQEELDRAWERAFEWIYQCWCEKGLSKTGAVPGGVFLVSLTTREGTFFWVIRRYLVWLC